MSSLAAFLLLAIPAAGIVYVGATLLREALRRPVLLLEELALVAAAAFGLGALVWLGAYLTESTLLGFEAPWTWLTAAHFGVAGAGSLAVTALVARTASSARALRVFHVLLAVHPLAFACTAAGIAGAPFLEELGALLYAALFAVQAATFVVAARPGGPRFARVALGAALVVPVVTIVPAVAWAFGRAFLDLDAMVRYHGLVNAVGHVGAGLAALAFLRPPRRLPPLAAPLSRLQSSGRVGPGFLDACRPALPRSPQGLTDSFSAYRRPGFDADQLHPDLVAFYERTTEFDLDATGRWHFPFRLAGWAWARLVAPLLGQLGLPAPGRSVEGTALESRIFDVDDAVDGRSGVRGWARTWKRGGRTLYVAAYAEHVRAGVRYMNIAFALPRGNLTSILHLRLAGDGGLELTSRHRDHFAGDQGVYFVRRGKAWRLPIDETITVYPAANAPPGLEPEPRSLLVARHEMWFLGLRYLSLAYRIRRQGGPALERPRALESARHVGLRPP